MKLTIVMLILVFKKFKVAYIFLLLFLCHYQFVKGHFYQKSGRLLLFLKQPLRGVVENDVLKFLAKSLKISVKEFFFIAFILNQKSYKNHICVYIIYFYAARESDKSYMINHVVYFGLYQFRRVKCRRFYEKYTVFQHDQL